MCCNLCMAGATLCHDLFDRICVQCLFSSDTFFCAQVDLATLTAVNVKITSKSPVDVAAVTESGLWNGWVCLVRVKFLM